ncbi:single-stranded DNA-binding protein [Neisseriaceae bacterium ESL0693]|nr:single-stranded DNA-binding protein [Neisseriaceae bacterium ESL0693]
MNPFLNSIEIIGNVGKKPILRHLSENVQTTRLSIAVTDKYQDKERTEWFPAILYGKQAVMACLHLNPGDSVLVRGAMHSRKYEQDGIQRMIWEIYVDKLVILISSKKEI